MYTENIYNATKKYVCTLKINIWYTFRMNTERGKYLDTLMDSWKRAERGRTMGDAFKALGIKRATWQTWRNGKMPSEPNLIKLAQFFDVTVEDIVTGGNAQDSALIRQRIYETIDAIELAEAKLGISLSKEKRRMLIEQFASSDVEEEELSSQIRPTILADLQAT